MNIVIALSRSSLLLRASSPRRVRARLVLLCIVAACAPAFAQGARPERARKLPAPERIVADYVKTVGGKQKLRALQDATYEWLVQLSEQAQGHARTIRKAPDATRTDIFLADRETNAAVNARTAWRRDADGGLRTLTGSDAQAAKLQAALAASGLLELKKRDVLARTVAYERSATEAGAAVYVVEFSRRDGARVRGRFGVESKLLMQVADEAHGTVVNYNDYRAENGVLEPHRVEIVAHDAPPLVFTLQSVRYNTGVSDALFEPPGDSSLNVVALLREVAHHQAEIEQRVSDYTFTRREIEREFDDHGTVKKEKTTVHEVYPLPGGARVLKLISEDGVMLAPERAARETQRVTEEIERATREYEQRKAKRERERAQQTGEHKGADDDAELGGLGAFVRVCEFVAPRRERFQDRDVIVFDFHARPGYKPKNRTESAIAKLIGVAWIDPADKQIMRLDARFPEGFKIGGGLVASLRPGSAFMFEQTRLADGVWLPHLSQINMAVKVFLVAGINRNTTREYSNYKRFTTNVGDATVAAPTPPNSH